MSNQITNSIFQIGISDKELTLFEGQYTLKQGMSYNSYVIQDEKTVVLDTMDERVTDKWLQELEELLAGKAPDYLVVSHMEPDHAYNIGMLAEKYPEMKIVGNTLTFNMLTNFFEMDFSQRKFVVMDGDVLDIGKHKLQFVTAPMVHWPEVMMTYEQTEKILFSADAFGRFRGRRQVGGRSKKILFWYCRKIWYAGTSRSKKGNQFRNRNHLPITWSCVKRKPWLLFAKIQYME